MRRSLTALACSAFLFMGSAILAQTLSFRAEQLSVQEGQADLKCVQVGIFMNTSGYDGNRWNQLNLSVEWSDPNLILRDVPVSRLTRFAGSSNGAADNYGLTSPATPIPGSLCTAGDTLNTVTLGNSSASSMMRNTINPSAGIASGFFVEEPSEINQRIALSMISLSLDPVFETQDGVEQLVAIIELSLKGNLDETDSLTLSFEAGADKNTISFLDGRGVITADANGNTTPGTLQIEACGAVAVQSQPSNQTVCDGGNPSFSVGVSGTGPFNYQWRKDGANVVGATGVTLNLTNVSTDDAGVYDCIITNSCGSVTSNAASLSIDPFVVSTSQATYTQGLELVTLGVDQECGVDPINYEWRELPSGNVVGSNATFTIDPPLQTSASYEVEVTSNSGSFGIIEFFVLANDGSVDPNDDGFSNIEDLYFAAATYWMTDDVVFDVDGSGIVGVNDLIFTFPAD